MHGENQGPPRDFGFSVMRPADPGTWTTFGVERSRESLWLARLCPAQPVSVCLHDSRLADNGSVCMQSHPWYCPASLQQHFLLLNSCKKILPVRNKAPDEQTGQRL